jgi:hypothetical protein
MTETPTINPERLAQFEAVSLKIGSHLPPNQTTHTELEMCALEAAAYIAGEPWSHAPHCVCRVITALFVAMNDSLPSDKARDAWLKPFIPRVIGTRDHSKEPPRMLLCADYAVRRFAAIELENEKLMAEAKDLRDLPEIINLSSAKYAVSCTAPYKTWSACEYARYSAFYAAEYISRYDRNNLDHTAAAAHARNACKYAAKSAKYARLCNAESARLAFAELVEKMLAV